MSIFNKLHDCFLHQERKVVSRNFSFLLLLQIFNYIFPLITFPYLVRVLGVEKFGLIAFVQSIIQYGVFISDYGFNLSATRAISLERNNDLRKCDIFSAVTILKVILALFSCALLCILVLLIPKLRLTWIIYIFSIGIIFGNVFFPTWFFQGIERMKYIMSLNLVGDAATAVLTFSFIKQQADFMFVPLTLSFGALLKGLLAIILIRKKFSISVKRVSNAELLTQVKEGWHNFISRIGISVYACSNTIILGVFTSYTFVGYYAAAEKIIRAIQGLIYPLNQAIYPWISKLSVDSKDRAMVFIRQSVKYFGIGLFVVSTGVFIFADSIVLLVLGEKYRNSISIVRILAFVPFLIGLTAPFIDFFFLGFGYFKERAKVIVLCTSLSLIFSVFFVYALSLNYIGSALSWLLTEGCVLVFSYISYRRLIAP